jgi:two-component system CheB/CheR fusion protein
LGRGSEFVVRLPLEALPAEPGVPEAPTAKPFRKRVLIVEDNLDAAFSLRDALESAGHEVAVALTGPDGIVKARDLRPEAVLCDIGLPGADGCEVARTIRRDPAASGMVLIALSGYALPADLERCRAAGFDAHLAKPPSLDAIERLLGSPIAAA